MYYWSEGDKQIQWSQQFAWKPIRLDDETKVWLRHYWIGDVIEKSRFYQPASIKMIIKQAFTISDDEYVEAKLIGQLPKYGIDK
mgnify:CR=1 FL=1|jgi:hypothetical protein